MSPSNRLADPNCPRCHGDGYIYQDTDSIIPVIGAPCACVERALARASVATRIEAAEFPDRYSDASFERFGLRNEHRVNYVDPERKVTMNVAQREIDERNLARAQELAARPLDGETIAFTGPPGVGKTYLACALLLAQIRQHGMNGLYLPTYTYVRTLLPEGGEPDAQREIRKRARTVDILLLDDLGVEKGSAFAMRELWDLLHHRTSNGLTTIVTSNLSIGESLLVTKDTRNLSAEQREASDLGRRIFSRLTETRVPPINWPEGSLDVRKGQEGAATKPGAIRDARRELRRALVDESTVEPEEPAS